MKTYWANVMVPQFKVVRIEGDGVEDAVKRLYDSNPFHPIPILQVTEIKESKDELQRTNGTQQSRS